MAQNLDTKKEEKKVEAYAPKDEEKTILDYLKERIPVLKDGKKKILDDIDFEEIMKDADREYMPRSLRDKKEDTSSVMLIQDEIKGMRGSRIVPITGKEDSEWRSDVSEPTLFVKIQTALSILVDQNPEAVFKALLEIYKPTSAIAKAIWQRSWGIANSKEMLKLFIFDLAKYGWAIGRTYPRLKQRKKEILRELDVDDPEKNKYDTVTITEYNDIFRERLDPYRTWIDDKANLSDPFSMDDWYFEKDYSKDDCKREFGMYDNYHQITFGELRQTKKEEEPANEETVKRKDMVTLGFYESKNKDLYAIYEPNKEVVLYYSPQPNDEGMLSCWDAVWTIRDPRTRYGIGLFEIIKNNKVLYDRLDNMDIDSLVMSIYTMLFYSGTNQLVGDGTLTVSPSLIKQKLPGTTVDQVKIDYSGKGREGAMQQQVRIDEITGLTPTLQGQVEGKTLGEVLHAKDAALKRLNIPLGNVAAALEQDAYLTLSWGNQVYSLPEVMEFVDQKELDEFMAENGREPDNLQFENQEEKTGKITADFPRVMELSLDEDRDGTLIESPENRFFTIGKDIPKKNIKWKGKITLVAQSIISPSNEMDRQRKMELYNIVQPVVQAIALAMSQGQYQVALDMAKPVVQILEIQNEKPENWLPDKVVLMINDPELVAKVEAQAEMMATAGQPLFVDPNAIPEPGAEGAPTRQKGGVPGIPTAPGAKSPGLTGIAPKEQITNPVKQTLSEVGKVR